jgi:hypothetical protein
MSALLRPLVTNLSFLPGFYRWCHLLIIQHLIIIIIIIIIINLSISFMRGIYTYIPETNHVPREHCDVTILIQLFMVRISLVPALIPLYLYVSTSRSMCAVPNMAVFCSSLTSWFPGMLITYFLNDFEMVPVALIITGITDCQDPLRVICLSVHTPLLRLN